MMPMESPARKPNRTEVKSKMRQQQLQQDFSLLATSLVGEAVRLVLLLGAWKTGVVCQLFDIVRLWGCGATVAVGGLVLGGGRHRGLVLFGMRRLMFWLLLLLEVVVVVVLMVVLVWLVVTLELVVADIVVLGWW